MKKGLSISFLFVMAMLGSSAQEQPVNIEEGRTAYKNRTFYNLENFWDSSVVCDNPHKGWEFHYFDNSITRYHNRLKPGDYLEDFPGLRNIYLRFAWSYLEPEEGVFNWQLIDTVIQQWTAKGYQVSFRITCKETSGPVFATPEWVMKAGAKGNFRGQDRGRSWEPDYGDPVFLQKLEAFHKAFAERYDGKPWLAYVDIGSIGEWGEGHTAFSGWYDVPVWVVKKHIDIYKKWYKKSILIISDDFMGQRDLDDGSFDKILQYCLANGIGFRDDSSGVTWYVKLGFNYANIRSPEIFDLVWERIPVVLESDHYGAIKKDSMWDNGRRLEKGIAETHATYISFHYWPREWLAENKDVAERLLNKCGYWYFPKYALLPDTLRKGSNANYLKMTWENHGVAPAYNRYRLKLQLENDKTKQQYVITLGEADNLKWMPGRIVGEHYNLDIPPHFVAGKYHVRIGLEDDSSGKTIMLKLPLKSARKAADGFYKMGEIYIR
ncbi:MAG TPA: DUF4832 domain-containing protein [Flavitalea sp.]|nr:DUF4832 domain-containing protein [Flavitalea sp.]